MNSEVQASEVTTLNVKSDHKIISGIGVVHGLASNDELLLLLTITLGLTNFLTMFIGLTVFTVGVVVGMIVYGLIIKIPISKLNQEKVVKTINITIASLTLLYAFYILFGGDTVNLLPIVGEDMTGALVLISFILGIKHSLDADHVVAITGILVRSPSVKRTITLSIAWALGHMITATIITALLFTFKEALLAPILQNFEFIVAFMLIFIAVLTILWETNIIKIGKSHHHHPGMNEVKEHGHTHD